jgi:ubiquinone/menaquinone biosynthesis C-methylase UbiE
MLRRKLTWACLLLCLGLSPAATPTLAAQATTAAPPQSAQHRATSTPYTGDLSIFESEGRENRLHINQVMDVLAIKPGKSVADIGAGSGWFTVRAARRVTSSGTVYAVDINPEALHYIEQRARKEQLSNVKTVMGKADDPQLPPAGVDAVLLLKTYHEVAEPVALLRNLRTSLRPGARIGIIDRDGNGTDHGIHKEVVLREADQAGYHLLEEHDDLVKADKMDYFLVLGVK